MKIKIFQSDSERRMTINMKIADMHCDTVSRIFESGEGLFRNGAHVDIEKLKIGGYTLQNFALFIDKQRTEALFQTPSPFEAVMRMADLYEEELAKNSGTIAPVYTYEDIERNEKDGKISALLTVEEGAVCQGELSKLRALYQRGVRMLTLTWNYKNELGYPNLRRFKALQGGDEAPDFYTPDTVNGLTQKGIEFVEEMERLGMIPDVSHLSDAGFYTVLSHTKKPFVASHSNARSVCPCVRNMTDDMIRSLAERGGVIGLNFCEDFLTNMSESERNAENIMEAILCHASHIANVGGIECLGLGSDFDGIEGNRALPDASAIERLIRSFEKNGWSGRMLDAVMGGNVLRMYRETLR